MKRAVIFLSAAIILTVGCRQKGAPAADLLPSAAFDTTINNVPVALYTLSAGDITMQVTNFGGRVVTLFTPDRDGNLADIVVGRRTISEYVNPTGERFLGACVGPVDRKSVV